MRVSDLNIDRVYINSVTREANYKMAENHFHFYYEIYYLKQGTCRMYISNQPYPLNPGDIVIIPPREVHINRYISTCERINIYFRDADLMDNGHLFLPSLQDKIPSPGIMHIPSAYRPQVEALLGRMLLEDGISDNATPEMMKLMFREMLINMARYGIHRQTDSPSVDEANREILSAVQYINEHYNQPITLDFLAYEAGLSAAYFSRKFHQVTGMGMKEYLNFVRLSNAEKELLSTKHSITDVALNCGFSNSNYFKDAFKKTYGMSPKAYRRSRVTDMITHQSILNAQAENVPQSGTLLQAVSSGAQADEEPVSK